MFGMLYWKQSLEKKLILCLIGILMIGSHNLLAQGKIIFFNVSQGKLIQAKIGDQLSVVYKGYLGQTETYKNTLTEIKDSSFVLGMPASVLNPNQSSQELQHKEIRYADVIAFRRIGLGRVMLKTSLSLSATIGTIILLKNLYAQNKVSDLGKIGISIGVGLGLNALINMAMPDKPNHKMKEGWEIRVLKD